MTEPPTHDGGSSEPVQPRRDAPVGLAQPVHRVRVREPEVVLGEDLFSAHQYVVLGNGNAELVKAASGTPVLLDVDAVEGERDCFDATISAYPSHELGMGAFYIPYIAGNQTAYLNSGRLDTFRVSGAELDEFLTLEDVPVRVPGTHGLGWSDELTAEGITELLE